MRSLVTSLAKPLDLQVELPPGQPDCKFAVRFDKRLHMVVLLADNNSEEGEPAVAAAKSSPQRDRSSKKRKRKGAASAGSSSVAVIASRAMDIRLDVRDAVRDEMITSITSAAWKRKKSKKKSGAKKLTTAEYYFKKLVFSWPGTYTVIFTSLWRDPTTPGHLCELPPPLVFDVVVTGMEPSSQRFFTDVEKVEAAEEEETEELSAAAEDDAVDSAAAPRKPKRPRKQAEPKQLRLPTATTPRRAKAKRRNLPKIGSIARDKLDATQFHLHEGCVATSTTVHFHRGALFRELNDFIKYRD
jgi:hypothetical protein|tara:strand:- start:2 stop:901 length:900 start_codon:yes stop_codon:yes gene_type:complete